MPEYRMDLFIINGNVVLDPDLQNRNPNPVSKALAMRFLTNFNSSTFECDDVVGFILIDDGDIDQSFLSGNLCRETIEEAEQSGEITTVGRIRFEASGSDSNLTFKILVQAARHNASTTSAEDYYQRAMEAAEDSKLDVTIKELDACLCANPEPILAMFAYFNLSAAVWDKFRFNHRRGDSVDDDEYLWVLGCNVCLRRALKVYETMPRHQQLKTETMELHQAIKESLSPTIHYGAYVFRFGQLQFRNVSGLPPLRCLSEVNMVLDR